MLTLPFSSSAARLCAAPGRIERLTTFDADGDTISGFCPEHLVRVSQNRTQPSMWLESTTSSLLLQSAVTVL